MADGTTTMSALDPVDVEVLADMERAAKNNAKNARKFARQLFTDLTGIEVPDIKTFTATNGDRYGMWLDVRVKKIERGVPDGD
jgi:hypothetical protein